MSVCQSQLGAVNEVHESICQSQLGAVNKLHNSVSSVKFIVELKKGSIFLNI